MTDEQVQSLEHVIRSTAAEQPNASDLNFLLSSLDATRAKLKTLEMKLLLREGGTHIQVMRWLEGGKYRTVMHRHDGCFRAVDEAQRRLVNADTIPLLADELMNWPDCGESYGK